MSHRVVAVLPPSPRTGSLGCSAAGLLSAVGFASFFVFFFFIFFSFYFLGTHLCVAAVRGGGGPFHVPSRLLQILERSFETGRVGTLCLWSARLCRAG